MTKAARTLVVLALGAALATVPTTAMAQQARVPDRSGDASRAVDVSTVTVRHGQHRIRAVARIPRLEPGKLSGTELLIRTPGRRKVYAVGVLRDRRGRVVSTSLSWRPLNDPVEPERLPCRRIGATLSGGRTVVSVSKACLTKTGPDRRIAATVRTINGTLGLEGAYFDDQTRFSPYLGRGRSHPTTRTSEGRVTARGGLVVRRLPTTASARMGTLRHGQVYPLSCEVSGTLVYRDDDADRESSNRWYRLPGDTREWVSALYVDDMGHPPPACGTGRTYRGRVVRTSPGYEAPTTRANAHGALARGSAVQIICRLRGRRTHGDDLWYHLPLGLWVPASAVSHTGPAPGYCTG